MSMSEGAAVPVSICTVALSPAEPIAGAEMVLTGRIACTPPSDSRGQLLLIRDHDGGLVGNVFFSSFDGEASETGSLPLRVPVKAGTYAWSAVCPAHETDGLFFASTSTSFEVAVKPRATHMVVWDIPSAVVAGARFSIKVGVKRADEGRLAGSTITIHDDTGTQLAVAILPEALWPGTTALHFTEVTLTAPLTKGFHEWEARIPASDETVSHAAGTARFGLRTVDSPECTVTLEIVDQEQTPLAGTIVVMHPYRTVSDENGIARLRVAKGDYTVMASRIGYDPMSRRISVQEDVATRAELPREPPAPAPEDSY